MSKGAKERPKRVRLMIEDIAPPPLSEELIAKLQHAVSAARRKRMPEPKEVSEIESPEKQS